MFEGMKHWASKAGILSAQLCRPEGFPRDRILRADAMLQPGSSCFVVYHVVAVRSPRFLWMRKWSKARTGLQPGDTCDELLLFTREAERGKSKA